MPVTQMVVLAGSYLKQIEQIGKEIRKKKVTGISGEILRVEAFVHGALCWPLQMLPELHTQNASANRGACTELPAFIYSY